MKLSTRDVVRVTMVITVTCLAADPALVIYGQESLHGSLFGTLWKLWQMPLIAVIMLQTRHPLRILKPLVPLLPWFLWMLLATYANGFDIEALKGLFDVTIPYIAACFMASWLCSENGIADFRRALWIAFWTIVSLAFALAFSGLQPYPGTTDPQPGAPPIYFVGVGNPIAFVALCACLVALTVAERHRYSVRNVVLRLAIIFIPCTLALYRAALGGLALIVIMSIIGPLLGLVFGRTMKTWDVRYMAALSVSCVLGIAILFPLVATKMFNANGGLNFSGREHAWPVYIEAAKDNSYLGLGPNGDLKVGRTHAELTGIGAAHSDYLMLVLSFGIPGLVLWLSGIASLVWRALARATPSFDPAVRAAAIYSLSALFVTMIVENIIRGSSTGWMYLIFPLLHSFYVDRQDAAYSAPLHAIENMRLPKLVVQSDTVENSS